jgi:hypothetical protein
MKTIICILALVTIFSCRKETTEAVRSSIISNEVQLDGIVFDTTPGPNKFRLRPNEKFLMADSFNVYTPCTINRVTFRVVNLGGDTKNVRLFIDRNYIAPCDIPIVNPFNVLDFDFFINVPLGIGRHKMAFRGISDGPDSLNVYFQIYRVNTLENVPVYNLPVSKKRRYYTPPPTGALESEDENIYW